MKAQEAICNLDTLVLTKGNHTSREQGVCFMEAVAWMAGTSHSDHPACVSPVLGAFLRRWNDDLDDKSRQKLKPYIHRVIGTAGDRKDEVRGWMLTDWMIRVHTPAWLDLAGIKKPAALLRTLHELTDTTGLVAAQAPIDRARTKAAAAWDAARAVAWDTAWAAARAVAWDAAWAAARAAVRDAARAAARAAAWDAAWDAARAAAWAAAWDAARAVAWDTAWDAAKTKLQPTVVELQKSAFELLDRMIA